MYKILIVSHSSLSGAFTETLRMINGGQGDRDVSFLSLQENEGIYEYEQKVDGYIQNVDGDVLVLADISFGSPARVAYEKLYSKGIHFRMISGVNLAMLITAFSMKAQSLDEAVAVVEDEGMKSITEVKFEEDQKKDEDE